MYYILLDEVQMMDDFVDVMNSFLHMKNVDVYVTGSNSKFLSKDIVTEFRGREDEIRVYPLSFAEFYSSGIYDNFNDAFNDYYTFGGLPYILECHDDLEKVDYLKQLFKETYIKDIMERNAIRHEIQLEELINVISSSIGSLTNPNKLSNTFQSKEHVSISAPTIKQYIEYLEDAFLIDEAYRYDIKGKTYIGTPTKYYFTDVGLRNARLNFRQQEETHLMENIIFNELKIRGYSVDVGSIETNEKLENGKYTRKQVEVDFVVNRGSNRYYIQSAYSYSEQETRPLKLVHDAFKKIVIVRDDIKTKRDDFGIVTMSLKTFLLNKNALDD